MKTKRGTSRTISVDVDVHRFLKGKRLQLTSRLRRRVTMNEALRRELGLDVATRDLIGIEEAREATS